MRQTAWVGKSLWAVRTSFMKKIKLTRGKFALVDDENFEWLNQWKWKAQKSTRGNSWYANRVQYTPYKKMILMHRLILGLTDQNIWCDHKDHNGLNNQQFNLRECNRSQNTANKRSSGSSKYLGVFSYKGKWRAAVKHNNVLYYLGTFSKEIDAAYAYNVKAKEMHGKFANLNII